MTIMQDKLFSKTLSYELSYCNLLPFGKYLSFIGWHLLGACTFGILTFLYVNPYQYYTEAELYHVLRDRM